MLRCLSLVKQAGVGVAYSSHLQVTPCKASVKYKQTASFGEVFNQFSWRWEQLEDWYIVETGKQISLLHPSDPFGATGVQHTDTS